MANVNFFRAFAEMVRGFFSRFSSKRWSRKNKSMMRETAPNSQVGCVHNPSYHPKGRKYAKGAFGGNKFYTAQRKRKTEEK